MIRKTTKKRRKSKLTFCLQVDHQQVIQFSWLYIDECWERMNDWLQETHVPFLSSWATSYNCPFQPKNLQAQFLGFFSPCNSQLLNFLKIKSFTLLENEWMVSFYPPRPRHTISLIFTLQKTSFSLLFLIVFVFPPAVTRHLPGGGGKNFQHLIFSSDVFFLPL